ncbi:TPA_asm: fusion protein [Rhyncholacis penicillata amalgavirus 1]|nr:TPA_asm: fusion protein [Rhyncholacis penicillata amalgavirus 1]
MASGSNRPLHNIRPDTLAPLREKIQRATALMVSIGFNAAVLTEREMHLLNITTDYYAKLLAPFLSATTVEKASALSAIGVRVGHFTSTATATTHQVVTFLMFLKSEPGMAAIAEMEQRMKLEKKTSTGVSVTEIAALHMGEFQLNEWKNDVANRRQEIEEKIAHYRHEISLLQEESARIAKEGFEHFVPMSVMPPPSALWIEDQCWAHVVRRYNAINVAVPPKDHETLKDSQDMFGERARKEYIIQYLSDEGRMAQLCQYIQSRVGDFRAGGQQVFGVASQTSWQQWVTRKLLKLPLKVREEVMKRVPTNVIHQGVVRQSSIPLGELIRSMSQLKKKAVRGLKAKPPLPRALETKPTLVLREGLNRRLNVPFGPVSTDERAIPVARSKWEAGVRKIIGGGEMSDWNTAGSMYRGGGCTVDAFKLLLTAREDSPGSLLCDHFTIVSAREALGFPDDLSVPDGRQAFVPKNFNEDATTGPLLFSFGILRKTGLRDVLVDYVWDYFDRFGRGETDESCFPYFGARFGFRTKLLSLDKALQKLAEGEPLGRCVMMMDAAEQVANTPTYHALTSWVSKERWKGCPIFKNSVVRASSEWRRLWDRVRRAEMVVELDWKKFDRERPREDLEFICDVIISCFRPRGAREERLLRGYHITLRRSLCEWFFVGDQGGIVRPEGMVPSGSLWTGFVDTALNGLYILAASKAYLLSPPSVMPFCCGDDNLTLFMDDPGDGIALGIRDLLNEWFRAGIEEDEFLIHRPPYHVGKEQACFPPGTDLKVGTSRLLQDALWLPFSGEITVDEASGRSHRWRYHFHGHPKFLSCYFLPTGLPIRPAKDSLEKLLFPEGVHKDIGDYEAAVLSQVVDNPFNDHNINHLKHRYAIIHQIRRGTLLGVRAEDVLWLARVRSVDGEPIPFPRVAFWRRFPGYVDLDDVHELQEDLRNFEAFVNGVKNLYLRKPSGGLDSFMFMKAIEDLTSTGAGQWGADVEAWFAFLRTHPATRYLRRVGTRKGGGGDEPLSEREIDKVQRALRSTEGLPRDPAGRDWLIVARGISRRNERKKVAYDRENENIH